MSANLTEAEGDGAVPSVVEAAAALLREEILSAGAPDVFIGSIDELAKRLRISRPTMRQALRILENEDIVVMRRGRTGGFYARPPTSAAVSRAASAYLRSQAVTFDDLLDASRVLYEEALRRAATHASPAERRELTMLAATPLADASPDESLETALAVGRVLTRAAGRATLVLFIEVIQNVIVESLGASPYYDRANRVSQERTHRVIARAVETGDADVAVAALHKQDARFLAWWKREPRNSLESAKFAGSFS